MKIAKEIENKIHNLKIEIEAAKSDFENKYYTAKEISEIELLTKQAAKSDFENKYYTAKEISEIELPTKQAIQFLEWVLN